jgi:dihydroceramidase
MSEMKGYWLPHSSSIDFCEPNYLISPFIAEFHNSWSSGIIALMGIIGMLYGNPLKEWNVTIMFLILTVVGLGSIGLHSTLHWFPQSSDEIPMLWQTLAFLYVLIISAYPSYDTYLTGYLFIALGVLQTYLYYCYQNIYAVFLISIIAYAATVIIWTGYLYFKEFRDQPYCGSLWKTSVICFVFIGFILWIIDMNLCDQLHSIYKPLSGFTLHVFWHIFAGYGTYLIATYLIVVRALRLGQKVERKWILGVFPIFEIRKEKKK